ncbi:glycosyltransferase family 2 protein [Chryseobacterium sp. Leaf394]|uniref:glycosyltransferase family 2 protein n=1 Tax=Chryseobacterium sp. Leaf394 TaxID=1736361 RepID=UPI0006F81A4D|nr:glycosyltransferase family 2 protein [Chryseobacterium sp. Leaf394]KQS93122.1 hypothetical protein ASG21_12045 [Chryseobacterium sp. Leaf394]
MAEVTVAIPVYNAEKFLAKAIASVLSQTYQDFELWIVDDGSTDSSMEIAQQFSDDKRVKIFSDGKNLALSSRLNTVAQNVETKYLARMDSDDIMHPQRIEKQLSTLINHPEIDVLGTNLYSINEDDEVVGKRYSLPNDFLGEYVTFIHPTIMGKTAWFKANPYDEKALRIEDADLWMRTKDFSVFKTMGEPLFFYRELGNQYYKKYFQGFGGVFYLLKKNLFSSRYVRFCLRYFIASFIYWIYYIVGKEHVLIQNRNQIKLNGEHFTKFINNEK